MASKLFYIAFSQMFLQGVQYLGNVGQLFYHVACKLQQTGCVYQKHLALCVDVEKELSMLGCLTETFGGGGGEKRPPELQLSHPGLRTPQTAITGEKPLCQP